MNVFISQLFSNPLDFCIITFVVIFSICLHEFCHAWTALKFGDTTAADRGHLTLNPLRQMGPISIIMFLILGFAWGAVPVNPAVLRARKRYAPTVVALAGPAANFALFLIAFLLFGFLWHRIYLLIDSDRVGTGLMTLLLYFGIYNSFLCIFNLLPIPGLDGWNALIEYTPSLKNLSSEFAKGVTIFLIFVLLFSTKYIFEFSTRLMEFSVSLLG